MPEAVWWCLLVDQYKHLYVVWIPTYPQKLCVSSFESEGEKGEEEKEEKEKENKNNTCTRRAW